MEWDPTQWDSNTTSEEYAQVLDHNVPPALRQYTHDGQLVMAASREPPPIVLPHLIEWENGITEHRVSPYIQPRNDTILSNFTTD